MEREQPITLRDRLLLYAAVLPFPETSKSGLPCDGKLPLCLS